MLPDPIRVPLARASRLPSRDSTKYGPPAPRPGRLELLWLDRSTPVPLFLLQATFPIPGALRQSAARKVRAAIAPKHIRRRPWKKRPPAGRRFPQAERSEEHTSELQSHHDL